MPAAFSITLDYGEEAAMMPSIHYQYTVDGEDFTMAGEASSSLKQTLKMMNLKMLLILLKRLMSLELMLLLFKI